MRTIDSIDINVDPTLAFRFARDIRNWPVLLPHYRWVHVLEEQGDFAVVVMAAKRGWIPVQWKAIQHWDTSLSHIYYQHIEGATRGMRVIWEIESQGTGTHINLIHDLTLDTPVIRSWIGKLIVGHYFVHYIASRTLQVMKGLLEKESSCVEQSSRVSDR